ncbi:hypothetical protein ASF39_00545 [Methylobacterium sp. Leaf108]|nr:hypothetical protein ASF39_00545 [Methylobacterium sp. Leaf108]
MKTFWVSALVGVSFAGLSLVAAIDQAVAQRGGPDYGYGTDEGDDRNRSDRRRRDNDDDRRRYRDRTDEIDRNAERDRETDEDRDVRRPRRYDNDDRMRDRGDQRAPRARFDEDEYLRCHPDVRRAVERGDLESGALHYRTFGRREGRKLTCPLKV